MTGEARCIVDAKNTLGEGCVWDPRNACVYWTDIAESRIHRLAPDGSVAMFGLPERAGFVLPCREPGFVVGLASRIVRTDAAFTHFDTIAVIEPDLPQTRVNDAAVDPLGGIVFGTFDERDRKPVASLYHLSPEGSVTKILGDFTISNGIAFSPDGQTLYFADTPEGTIRRFRSDDGWHKLIVQSPLARPDIAPGKPDGAVVDAEGYYWNARVWGGCLARISPEGKLDRLVTLPTKGPTCVTIGGPDLRTLYATTLRIMHTEEELAAAPAAGGLFAVDLDTPGTPQRLADL